MIRTDECPSCNGSDTKQVHAEWHFDAVEEVRICRDCPTQYTVSYGNPTIVDVHTENEP